MDSNNTYSSIGTIVMKWDLFRKAPIDVYIIQKGRFKALKKFENVLNQKPLN